MSFSISNDNGVLTVTIKDTLAFAHHETIGKCIEEIVATPNLVAVNLDFANIQYLDSMALGSLLLFRGALRQRVGISLKIINLTDDVKKILEIAHFTKIFSIT